MDVGRLVARAAQRHANRIALDGPTGQQTFAEIGARVPQLARAMLGLGLRPGDRVLDLQTNTNTYVETDLGLATAGLVRVALNYRLHPSDWLRIAADCDARALIYDTRFADATVELRDAVDHVIAIGPDAGGDVGLPYEALLAKQSAQPLLLRLDPDSVVSLNYSSGTTGKPKGAMRTHRNRMASIANMVCDVIGRLPGGSDTYVHAGPITHTSGLFVLPFFTFGATQLILPSWDPEEFLDAVEHRGATHTALVPTMIARLLALPDCTPQRTRGLEMLGYAGAPMPAEQIRQAMERITPNLVQYYGLVEAIPPVTVLDAADHARGVTDSPHLLSSAGRPCLGVEISVRGGETGRQLTIGETGEVLTRGEHVMPGYWGAEGRDDLSTTVVDGWLHTGDLGRLDADERLYLSDRIDDMIISGGYNIYPREVENVIAAMPGVHEVAVLGVDDPEWGQHVTALYSVRPGAAVTADDIIEHCRQHLASYKKPKEVRMVDHFPLSSTGKISKKLLREQLATDAHEA